MAAQEPGDFAGPARAAPGTIERRAQRSSSFRNEARPGGDATFFNLIERDNPDCPIRRQVIPRIEETWTSPYDMADPCGEDSHMPVPGLVHRYPDRVLFLV